jgi:hypothetical protein
MHQAVPLQVETALIYSGTHLMTIFLMTISQKYITYWNKVPLVV